MQGTGLGQAIVLFLGGKTVHIRHYRFTFLGKTGQTDEYYEYDVPHKIKTLPLRGRVNIRNYL